MSAALAQALVLADAPALEATRSALGPFEAEALRLLDVLPGRLAEAPLHERTDVTMQVLLEAQDRDEGVRAAVSLIASLARSAAGADLEPSALLRHLGMVDDAGLLRLARLWTSFAVLAQGPPSEDATGVRALLLAVEEEGPAATQWLRLTARVLAGLAIEVSGTHRGRVTDQLDAVERLSTSESPTALVDGVQACLVLARLVRRTASWGPSTWLLGRYEIAAQAVGEALVAGLGLDVASDLLVDLVEDDVEGPDLIDAFLCAAAMLLCDIDPEADPVLREAQVHGLLDQLPGGAKGSRWMLDTLLREAPDHDPLSVDLRPVMPPPGKEDPDRAAQRAGRSGVVRAGLTSLQLLADALGQEAHRQPADVLGLLLSSGLENHDLLRRRDGVV